MGADTEPWTGAIGSVLFDFDSHSLVEPSPLWPRTTQAIQADVLPSIFKGRTARRASLTLLFAATPAELHTVAMQAALTPSGGRLELDCDWQTLLSCANWPDVLAIPTSLTLTPRFIEPGDITIRTRALCACTSLQRLKCDALELNGACAVVASLPRLLCLQELVLPVVVFEVCGAEDTAAALRTLTALTHLNLHLATFSHADPFAGSSAAEVFAILPQLPHLAECLLPDITGRDVSVDSTVRARAQLVPPLRALTRLSLSSHTLNCPALPPLHRIFSAFVTLGDLEVVGSQMASAADVAEALTAAATAGARLHTIRLVSTHLTTPLDNATALGAALGQLTGLQALRFDRAFYTPASPSQASQTPVLTPSQALLQPVLARQALTELLWTVEKDFQPHLTALSALSRLEHLSLLNLNEAGASALSRALPALTQLRAFSLMRCSEMSAAVLAAVLPQLSRLTELQVTATEVSAHAGPALVAAVASPPSLCHLSLQGNGLSDDAAAALASRLAALKALTALSLRGNCFGAAGAAALAAGLPQCERLVHLDVDNMPGLGGAAVLAFVSSLPHASAPG